MERTGSEMNTSAILLSPVTLQMQKHLLSSTIQTMSDNGGKGKSMRNGSCSPTPALPYTPTPSPSPFNSLSLGISSADLNLSLSADAKALNFLNDKSSLYPSTSSSFVDLGGIGTSSSGISPSTSRFSPQLELNSVLNFSGQSALHLPVSSQQDGIKDYIMMDTVSDARVPCSSISIIPTPGSTSISLVEMTGPRKQINLVPVTMTPTVNLSQKHDSIRVVSDLQNLPPITSVCNPQYLTAIPVTTQITCLTNLSSAVTSLGMSSIGTLDCLPASSSSHPGLLSTGPTYEQFTSPTLLPNKKRRLLTFLAEDGNLSAIDTGMSVGKSSDEPTLIINSGKPQIAKKNASTIFLSNESIPCQTQSSDTNMCIAQGQSLNKNEQTLIINSDGTPAALITPVTVPQKQVGCLLTQYYSWN